MANHYDTIIIGAGLSGLMAAWKSAESGRSVLVLERESTVGGRQRTREVEGFLLDRGFQLLNPSYPSVKKYVDSDALDLHAFGSGVMVRTEKGLDLLAHPARHPQHLAGTLTSDLVDKSEIAALAGWFGKTTIERSKADLAIGEAWDSAGVNGPLRNQVLEPFLAGVVATDDLSTSATYVRFLFQMFALGRPSLPSRGIQALPKQLAAKARRAGAEIRTNAPVDSYSEDTGHVSVTVQGETLTADSVIVAVGPEAVGGLTGREKIPTNGLTTWWFTAEHAPTDKPFIAVDGTRSGPVLNTAVVTNVAPSYSPDGTPLIQASGLLTAEHVNDDEARSHTAKIWGMNADDLELLARDDIAHSLPEYPAGSSAKKTRISERVFVAGDHQTSPSIEGALDAGVRAAAEVQSSR